MSLRLYGTISGCGRSSGAVIPALGSGRYSPGPNIVLSSWLKGSDPNFTITVFWGQPGARATVSILPGFQGYRNYPHDRGTRPPSRPAGVVAARRSTRRGSKVLSVRPERGQALPGGGGVSQRAENATPRHRRLWPRLPRCRAVGAALSQRRRHRGGVEAPGVWRVSRHDEQWQIRGPGDGVWRPWLGAG